MGDSGDNGSKQDLVICNILCYISTARHSLRVDDIIRTCFVFYQPDDITKGKDLLCNIIGEVSKRRRGENRITQELQDIIDLIGKAEDNGIKLPTFVADNYNSLPPSSGFELVAAHIVTLNDEISSLKKEIESLREIRLKENFIPPSNNIMQEDLLFIKGELRKLNHKLMKDDLRRNSLLLSAVGNHSLDEQECIEIADCARDSHTDNSLSGDVAPPDSVVVSDIERKSEGSLLPSAPELSQNQQFLDRLLFDEGGEPSAPSFADICKSQHREIIVEDSHLSEGAVRERNSHKILLKIILLKVPM